MTVIDRNNQYNENERTETRVQKVSLWEDWLALAEMANNAARFAFVIKEGNEEQKKKASEEYKKTLKEVFDQIEILKGYAHDSGN